jgi:phosphatidylglycerophosphatase A
LGVLAGAALLFGLGWAAAARMVRSSGARDPQNIVIDEVVGQLLTLAVAPFGFGLWAAGLVLFRAADILKPFPAGWADRHLGGGLGIMLDDVFAALWSAPLLWGLTLLLGR